MRNKLLLNNWWFYLALAVAGYLLADWGHGAAAGWAALGSPAKGTFVPAFLTNFLAVLRVALPVFFAGFAVYTFVRARTPIDDGRTRPLRRGLAADATAGTSTARPRPHFSHESEVVDLNYGLLRRMEWRRFEIVCAEYLRCLDYEVMETGFGLKDAVDLEVFQPGKSDLAGVVRCIAAARPADLASLRDLAGAMRRRRVAEGMVFSVCGFTRRAVRFARRHRITLVSGESLGERVRTLEPEARAAMTRVATADDYTTPTCTLCGIKLVLRRRAHSRPGSGEFWGCVNHPRCRVTMPF